MGTSVFGTCAVLVPVCDADVDAALRSVRGVRGIDPLLAALPEDWLVYYGASDAAWHEFLRLGRGYPVNLGAEVGEAGDAAERMLSVLPGDRPLVVAERYDVPLPRASLPRDLVETLRLMGAEAVVAVRRSRSPAADYVDAVPEFQRAAQRRLSEWALTGLYAFASSARLHGALENSRASADPDAARCGLARALAWLPGAKLVTQLPEAVGADAAEELA